LNELNVNNEIFNKSLRDQYSDVFFIKLSYFMSKIPGIQNFQCLGDITLSIEEQEYNFEVHCRVNTDTEIEFLFNDVSRTKLREKQLAEFRYKSLFLSKIVHEFKNPLICITELLNQSFEVLPRNVKKNDDLIVNLQQIKYLSNFLQILIKDLNYFSESQFGKRTEYEENETDLNSVVEFCCKIAQTLLIKSNKSKKVELKVNIDQRLPEKIITDEWRLKQVLVNLISNSVKFTLFGSITLDISLVEYERNSENIPKIKFLVKDTGIGIKEYKQKDIFKPFQKDSTSNFKIQNEFGAGLGLSIANEIATKLGQGLEFQSFQGEGTSFWFYLPVPKDLIREKIINCDESINSKEIRGVEGSKPNLSISSKSIADSSVSDDSLFEYESENSKFKISPGKRETYCSVLSNVSLNFYL
jgi:signal transduction histidine kinase